MAKFSFFSLPPPSPLPLSLPSPPPPFFSSRPLVTGGGWVYWGAKGTEGQGKDRRGEEGVRIGGGLCGMLK